MLHPLGQSLTPFVVMSETQEMELHDAKEVAMDVLECQRPSMHMRPPTKDDMLCMYTTHTEPRQRR